MLDGSNDTGLNKVFSIAVRVFEVNFNRVMTKFFDVDPIDNQLNKDDISWDCCLVIGLDSANLNIGITIPLNLES